MTTTTETATREYGGDPRIGSLTDTYTWRAIPAPKLDDRDPADRLGGYCVVAGDLDEADVWIEVTAEDPKAVAEFIVQAVKNEHTRQTDIPTEGQYTDAVNTLEAVLGDDAEALVSMLETVRADEIFHDRDAEKNGTCAGCLAETIADAVTRAVNGKAA